MHSTLRRHKPTPIFELRRLRRICAGLIICAAQSLIDSRALENFIYWRNNGGGDNAYWILNDGYYGSSGTYSYNGENGLQRAGTGHFDKSRFYLDGLWRNTYTGENSVTSPVSDTTNLIPIQPMTDLNWEIVGTGFFSGANDTSTDILWRNKITGDNAVWFMDGMEFLGAALLQEVPDLNWKVGGAADFNGDNYTDIVWHHTTTGLNYVWYMQGTSLIATAPIQTAADTNWVIAGADFFNSDSKPDLLWRNEFTGYNAIWFMNGTSVQSTYMLPYAASYWSVGGTGNASIDIDGDWLPDFWERRYFGNLDQTGSGNPDGDYYNNQSEWNYKTDPTQPFSATLANGVDNFDLLWSYSGSSVMRR